jgi:hypothetical protein
MKHMFVALAAVAWVAVGCGGPAVEPAAEEPVSVSQELNSCPGSLPECASLEGTLCKPPGSRRDCCEGSLTLACGCSSTYKWLCP